VRWLTDLSIRTKLYAKVVVIVFSLLLILGLSSWLLATYQVDGPVYKEIVKAHELNTELTPAVITMDRPFLLLRGLLDARDDNEVEQGSAELQKMEQLYRSRLLDHWKRELPDGPLKKILLEKSNPPAEEIFRLAREKIVPALPVKDKGKGDPVRLFQTRIIPLFNQHMQAINEASTMTKQEADKLASDGSHKTRVWQWVLWLLCGLLIAATAVANTYLAREIVSSTRLLQSRLKEMASGAGDLTARVAVDSHDELGDLAGSINALIAKIHVLVSKIRESSLQLLATASEIAATARQQEGTAQGLSASTTEVAAAVREISATSQELARTMEHVYSNATQAADLASSGRTQLGDMEKEMEQLVYSTASISGKLATIREKADNINVVVTTITKVADQTNLLSINAAIEAEKAGEYGRGFLVVAREIRRLADQTAVATLDIENIVRQMQEAVSAGVMQMDKFGEEVRRGVSRIGEINGKTGRIIEEVQGLRSRFQHVNEGMRNQSAGAAQINEAMAQIANSTQQTQAALEEFHRATANLRSAVEGVNQEIAAFRV
jgi:methyl-accepting chemotaxis protein WspA